MAEDDMTGGIDLDHGVGPDLHAVDVVVGEIEPDGVVGLGVGGTEGVYVVTLATVVELNSWVLGEPWDRKSVGGMQVKG